MNNVVLPNNFFVVTQRILGQKMNFLDNEQFYEETEGVRIHVEGLAALNTELSQKVLGLKEQLYTYQTPHTGNIYCQKVAWQWTVATGSAVEVEAASATEEEPLPVEASNLKQKVITPSD